jgi:hypothetical protein
MAMVSASRLQKTHNIAFESKRLCYPWHPWYDRLVLTRAATGAHADAAYFCKLPDAPVDAMLTEIPHWMFDASHCAALKLSEVAVVNVPTLLALKRLLVAQRISVPGPVVQPELSRHAGHGEMDGEELGTEAKQSVGVVSGKPRRKTLGTDGSVSARRGGSHSRATASEGPAECGPPQGQR